ncbi:MAG: DUF2784 domain-containing protein [Bacteroidia bacterium]|nr:DUF2784 domain-containing protein [Bacteroidia bacterium]
MYKFLDIFFLVFHTLLIFFNLFGWIWKRTRKINLVTLLLTGLSWFALGIFYGIGYCPLTDWHWEVLHKLGRYDLPNSYTKYLADRITGLDFNARLADTMTAALFFVALAASLYVNIRPLIKKYFISQ